MRHAAARPRQGGAAAVVLLVIVIVALSALILGLLSGSDVSAKEEQATARALGLATAALIARAAADANRPGSLPCPDVDNDGDSTPPADWTGSACSNYLGRLPWSTLDLPDLRDGAGERLWYTLTPVFRDYLFAGTLNSQTPGTLSVSVNGALVGSDVVAIVFAPGTSLAGQNRSGAGVNNKVNYLEGGNVDGDSAFETTPKYPLRDDLNDRAAYITRDMLMAAVQQRIAREARYCLDRFAAAHNGRFPWAAQMQNPPNYTDSTNTRFGRVARTLTNTATSFGSGPLSWPASAQSGITCFDPYTWWGSWSETLLYHVAPAYDPSNAAGGPCAVGTCLTVNGNSGVKAVIIVAGHPLVSPPALNQSRPSNSAADYLEVEPDSSVPNQNGQSTQAYAKARPQPVRNPGFNDTVECLSESGLVPC